MNICKSGDDMFTVIKGAQVFSPFFIGQKDVWIVFDRIAGIDDDLSDRIDSDTIVIDGTGKRLVPGFIDQHVHITGGGGEGGFATRTPEIDAADLIKTGITTVIGLLGTDGVTRSLEGLYAKARQLEEQGFSTFIYTGNYAVPVMTFTGSITKDLCLIDKVIGVGEIALSDHRSNQPTRAEIARIVSEARVGGMLSGKAGITLFHLGDHPDGMKLIMELVNESSLPITQLLPTHVNRNRSLFLQVMEFARQGGTIDLTAGFVPDAFCPDCVPAGQALQELLANGIPLERISMSSDGNGSIPIFDAAGNLLKMDVGSCTVLLEDFQRTYLEYKIPFEQVLSTVTINPAKLLKLQHRKGSLEIGKDADLLLMDDACNISLVMSMGKILTV